MKICVKKILILLFPVVLFSACGEKNEEENEEQVEQNYNYVKIGNDSIVLGVGLLENYGLSTSEDSIYHYNGSNFDLSLFQKGINLVSDEGEYFPFGFGFSIYFQLYSTNENYLDTGHYYYSTYYPISVKTFDDAEYTLNILEEDYYKIVSGYIYVKKNGSTYEISINCLDENDVKITGHFKGTLKTTNYSTPYSQNTLNNTYKNKKYS